MKRTLIKQGQSSLTISLPSTWTKKFSLKGGDEISLIEEDKNLIISTNESFVSKKSKIDVSGLRETLLWVNLSNIYVRGDDEVEINFSSRKEFDMIVRITNSLIGFAVVEQGKNHCVLKDVSGISEDSFDALLRRIFLLTIMMAEEGFELLSKDEVKNISQISERDEQVNKLVNFCLRTLNKKGHSDFKKTPIYTTIIYLLEQLSDEYARMFRDVNEIIPKRTLVIFKRVIQLNKDFQKLFYGFNQELASKMLTERDNIRREIHLLLPKAKPSEIMLAYRLKKITELILDIVKIDAGLNL
jgi:phosphate uptake regulator